MNKNNIIKGPFFKPTARAGVVKRDLIDAVAESRRLILEAETKVESMRRDAQQAALKARQQAYDEGIESSLLKLNQDLIEAREIRESALTQVELDVLRLSVKIAEKIIGRELELDDRTVADIVATALAHARQNEVVTVKINPADAAVVKKHRARLDPGGRVRFIDFSPDPRVKRGGCLIVTETGTIDAQLSTQLRVLERALLARAGARSKQR
jgi:type III secretion protein L